MSVLERSELEASPLADLHAIADQLGLDGFRRLRKSDLIDAILDDASQGGGAGDGSRDRGDADDHDGGSDGPQTDREADERGDQQADREGDESERAGVAEPRRRRTA